MFTSVLFGKILTTFLFLGLVVIAFSFKKEQVLGDDPYHIAKDLRLWVVFLMLVLTILYWIF